MLYDQISITLAPQAIEQIDQLVKLIEHEWNNYDNYSNTIIQGLVIQFFVTALRGQTFSSQNDDILKETHFSLINAIHYVQCHYVEDPSLRETAEAVHTAVEQAQVFPIDKGTLQGEATFLDRSQSKNGKVTIVSSTQYTCLIPIFPDCLHPVWIPPTPVSSRG